MWFKPAHSEYSEKIPGSWQQMQHGSWWRDELCKTLEPEWETIFGHYLLKLGPLSAAMPTPCRIKQQYTVWNSEKADVQAELTALPFQEHSVDAVLLTHALEYQGDPHQVLREADRALRPDGYMVVVVVNPISLASLGRLWPPHRKKPLWNSRLFPCFRVKDWLGLLNYEITSSGYFAGGAPLSSSGNPERGWKRITNTLPSLSGGYYLVAKKREWPLTLQRSSAKSRGRHASSAMPVGSTMHKS